MRMDAAQYDVRAIEVDASVEMADLLERRCQAKPLPGSGKWRDGGLKNEDEQVGGNVNGHGFSIVQSGKPSWQGKSGDPESQKQLIRLVGEALGAEPAAVKYGAMFVTEPEGY